MKSFWPTMLSLIRAHEESGFNPQHVPVPIRSLCNVTGLDEHHIRSICDEMVGAGILERTAPEGLYRTRRDPFNLVLRIMELEERVRALEER